LHRLFLLFSNGESDGQRIKVLSNTGFFREIFIGMMSNGAFERNIACTVSCIEIGTAIFLSKTT
jgi:hypothetical protein